MSVKLTQNQFYGKEELLPYTNPEGTTYLCTDTKKMYIYKNDKRPYLLFDTSSINMEQADNKPKVINFGFVGPIGNNPPAVALKVNNMPFFYVTKNDVLFLTGYVAETNGGSSRDATVYNRTYVVKNRNEGTYGFGSASFLLDSDLHLIESRRVNNIDVVNNDPNAHVEDLGDITGEDFLDVINTASPNYVISGATNWYFKYIQDGVEYLYGFEGPNGTYGNGQLQFNSDQLFIVYRSDINPETRNIYDSDGEIVENRIVNIDSSSSLNFMSEGMKATFAPNNISLESSKITFKGNNNGGEITTGNGASLDIKGLHKIKILPGDSNVLKPPVVGQVLTAINTDGTAEWQDASGGGPSIIVNELPSVFTNVNNNSQFTTSQNFTTGSTKVYVNGIRQRLGLDYNESGNNTVIFTSQLLFSDNVITDYTAQ